MAQETRYFPHVAVFALFRGYFKNLFPAMLIFLKKYLGLRKLT